ncbi:MAG: nucleotidyltransferase family protein [Bacillota bacterium]
MTIDSLIYEKKLIEIIKLSPLLVEVFERSQKLKLDQYYVGAGCIVQTVWNYFIGNPLEYGIDDIDIVYFDTDLTYQKEDRIIKLGKEVFRKFPIKVDIKNQARVHLWYKEKFGIDLEPYSSLVEAIDSWPTTATSLGVRFDKNEEWKVYSPYGFDDLFQLKVRANKKLITQDIYKNKYEKWKRKWPELNIISW